MQLVALGKATITYSKTMQPDTVVSDDMVGTCRLGSGPGVSACKP